MSDPAAPTRRRRLPVFEWLPGYARTDLNGDLVGRDLGAGEIDLDESPSEPRSA